MYPNIIVQFLHRSLCLKRFSSTFINQVSQKLRNWC